MQIGKIYSHLNGLEWLEVRRPKLWKEIKAVIADVDATKLRTKRSKEKRKMGKNLYSPIAINAAFKKKFNRRKWKRRIINCAVCEDVSTIRKTLHEPYQEQRRIIKSTGKTPFRSYNETDFVKEDVAVEVQLGKYSFIALDLFVKHMAFYVSGEIEVGVEILPMKSMQAQMSSGPGYFEWALYNILRQGRSIPAVPLVIIGVTP